MANRNIFFDNFKSVNEIKAHLVKIKPKNLLYDRMVYKSKIYTIIYNGELVNLDIDPAIFERLDPKTNKELGLPEPSNAAIYAVYDSDINRFIKFDNLPRNFMNEDTGKILNLDKTAFQTERLFSMASNKFTFFELKEISDIISEYVLWCAISGNKTVKKDLRITFSAAKVRESYPEIMKVQGERFIFDTGEEIKLNCFKATQDSRGYIYVEDGGEWIEVGKIDGKSFPN